MSSEKPAIAVIKREGSAGSLCSSLVQMNFSPLILTEVTNTVHKNKGIEIICRSQPWIRNFKTKRIRNGRQAKNILSGIISYV